MTHDKLGLFISLSFYLILAFIYSVYIPLNSGPDEMAHFTYMTFIADHQRLPMTYKERAQAAYKSDLPPLYHLLVALPNAWVDPHQPPILKRVTDSPRRQLIALKKDIWTIYNTEDEYLFPYRGEYLRWYMGRWISLLCGAGMVYFTWLTARQLWPDKPFLVSAATLGLATLPTLTFTSAMLNYESLQGLLTSLTLWRLISWTNSNQAKPMPSMTALWLLGLVIGLAIVTKYSTVLLPLEAVIGLWFIFRPVSIRQMGRPLFLVSVGIAIPTVLWFSFIGWYFNNVAQLGWVAGLLEAITGSDKSDMTTTVFMSWLSDDTLTPINGLNHQPWWQWLQTFYSTMWLVNVPHYGWVWSWALWPAVTLSLIALIGLIQVWWQNNSRPQLALLLLHVALFLPLPLLRFAVTRNVSDTGQGRHLLFPAASALAILLVWGVSQVKIKNTSLSLIPFCLLLIGWNIAQFRVMTQVYPLPLPVHTVPSATPPAQHILDKPMTENLTLLGYNDPELINQTLRLTLFWQSQGLMSADALTELSLVSAENKIVSQWLSHPLNGQYPTRAWDVGDVVRDSIELPLSGVAQGDYHLTLRLLEANSLKPIGDKITLTAWQMKQSFPLPTETSLDKTVYQYRQTIVVNSHAPQTITIQDPNGTIWSPLAVTEATAMFMVEPRWVSGIYQLQTPERVLTLTIKNEWNRSFTPPSIEHPVQANFANELYFLGYHLPSTPIKAGQSFPITLYWQAPPHKTPQAHFIQFNHIYDGQGKLYGGHDRVPLETYSTLLWAAGEVVADGYTLTLDPSAPPGSYYLDVGFYFTVGESGINLPLVIDGKLSEQNHITIEFQVHHDQ